jgi:hypothetical protein
MRVFTAEFNGIILGGNAVVVAEDSVEARALVRRELKKIKDYSGKPLMNKNKGRGVIRIKEMPTPYPSIVIQSDGDY